MWHHAELTDAEVRAMIRRGQIRFGGYTKNKIYGTLRCGSGKRMLRVNRVFFASEAEARRHGYIPCGNCMRQAYKRYLNEQSQQEAT
jgi:methylphosphotriester-DNA--protein-cysteine methyltransferase